MECTNHKLEFVKRYKTNGGRLLNKQCLQCGEVDSHAYKLSEVSSFESLPLYDNELKEKQWLSQRESKKIEYQENRIEWIETVHKEYLRSPEWREKRILVLDRDKGICQACLISVGNDVHHLTYANYKKEPLFDLITVCRPCHNLIHS